MIRSALVVAATLLVPTIASADGKFRDMTVLAKPQADAQADAPGLRTAPLAGVTLFINRCIGGCSVKPGMDDATNNTSQIPTQPSTLPEFTWTGTQWEDMLQCVREVYSPYNVKITDVRPTSGGYNMIYVAGHPQDVGINDNGVGGVSPVTIDCSAIPGGVAFAFAFNGQEFAQEDAGNFTWGMCWIVAQETAHTFGLDHEFSFPVTMRSACNDPMTYLSDCGGEKFFRNADATCGEFGPARPGCGPTNGCGTTQNSHQKLLAVLGPGTPITTPPVMSLQAPMANAVVKAGTSVIGTGSSQRGVAKVELWINGYKWGETVGAPFLSNGQPASPYTLVVPGGVPDSKLDVTLKAFDDLGIEGDSPTVAMVKGKAAGCDAAVMNADGTVDTCLKGQACSAGKCAWADAGKGMFGDACTYPQFCANGTCEGTADSQICTRTCDTAIMDSCPAGYECLGTAGAQGICFTPQPAAGCCSVGNESLPAVAAHGGIAFATLGLLFGRRRRKSTK